MNSADMRMVRARAAGADVRPSPYDQVGFRTNQLKAFANSVRAGLGERAMGHARNAGASVVQVPYDRVTFTHAQFARFCLLLGIKETA